MKMPDSHLVRFALASLASLTLLAGASAGEAVHLAKITPHTVVTQQAAQVLDKAHPSVRAVMAVQQRHSASLMSMAGVVGTAVGIAENGRPVVLVLTERTLGPVVIPAELEGVAVVEKVTGKLLALKPPPGKGKSSTDTTARFDRPVPIGVSTGNAGECFAGTIGARVKAGADVYALSNNHVYALENTAANGSAVLQPGRYDSGCTYDPANEIGTLYDYEPIVFSTTANNVIDAAIALSSTDNLGNATPSDGYGTPRSAAVTAALDEPVQKYGRSTALTKGIIIGINATVNVGYSSGTAWFVDQVVVYANRPFIRAGDSGSLLVTDPGRNPVGLLFAGDASGKYAIANSIDAVLTRSSVVIDGE
jgi:hypothetical protein